MSSELSLKSAVEHTQIYSSLHSLCILDLRLMMGVQGLYDLQTPALQSDFPVKQWREAHPSYKQPGRGDKSY